MSDSIERPAAEDMGLALPSRAVPSADRNAGGRNAKPEVPPRDPAAGAVARGPGPGEDRREALKQRLEETRLPADLRAQILAQFPPAEEEERLVRELQEQGGLSSEEFLASLGLEVEPQP